MAKRLDQAVSLFRGAAETSSGYLEVCAWNMVGQTARLQGSTSVALRAFERLAEVASSQAPGLDDLPHSRNVALLAKLALVYQAEILEEQEKWPAALCLYERLLAIDPKPTDAPSIIQNPGMYEKIARLYWRAGDRDRAWTLLQELLDRWPQYQGSAVVRLAMASLELQPASHGKLLKLPCFALPIGSSAPKSVERIVQLVTHLQASATSRASLRLKYGWSLFESSQFAQAATQFSQAARIGMGDTDQTMVQAYANLSLALTLLQQGQVQEAQTLASSVAQTRGQDHLYEMAKAIVAYVDYFRQEKRKVEPCDIEVLQ